MIIGYYEQSFFGGGTYYKLSKRDNESRYKMEYSHSTIPNYIPEVENFIKEYETLKIEDDNFCGNFEGKIKSKFIDSNKEIEELINYILKCNWKRISKEDYTDDVDDGTNWELYIDIDNKRYHIDGYEKYPKEIQQVIKKLNELSRQYLEKIKSNKKDKEVIDKNMKNNIKVMKFLHKKNVIDKKTLKDYINNYKNK